MDRKTDLSPRQREIMLLAAEGLTDKEIAQQTGLSLGTLRSHWDRMRARQGASSRGEVIARAAEDTRHVLLAELEILRHALTHQRTFVWTATPDGTVDYVNDYFSSFSGLPHEAILGSGCRALMNEEGIEQGRRRWRDAQAGAAGYRAQVLFRSGSGNLVPHVIELAPLQIVEGRVTRWLGTASEAAENLT
jgi:PAS domain S-box-containing protein